MITSQGLQLQKIKSRQHKNKLANVPNKAMLKGNKVSFVLSSHLSNRM